MITRMRKIRNAYREGRVQAMVRARAKRLFYGMRYVMHDEAADRLSLHCPDYVEPSHERCEVEIVERIFRSFKKMKADQRQQPARYVPSSLWQGQLETSYSHLAAGLRTNDIRPFHYFLANFGTWKTYHGLESNVLIRDNMTSLIRRRYLKNVIFYNQLKIWKRFYNNRKPLSALTYPTYGNQAGAYLDRMFVGTGSFFNEIYGSILSGIIHDIERPVVADLGAGYGKLAYFTLRDRARFAFIDFDLPEPLCLAAYYLMHVWPQKKVLLYGEEDYSPAAHRQYDMIFMPSYEITKVGPSSVDLFINKNSLGEMGREAAAHYIAEIAKATNYFFHLNHEIESPVYTNHERGLLGFEYPVPMETFRLLFRYPDIGQMLYQGGLDLTMDQFLYLYERKTPERAGGHGRHWDAEPRSALSGAGRALP